MFWKIYSSENKSTTRIHLKLISDIRVVMLSTSKNDESCVSTQCPDLASQGSTPVPYCQQRVKWQAFFFPFQKSHPLPAAFKFCSCRLACASAVKGCFVGVPKRPKEKAKICSHSERREIQVLQTGKDSICYCQDSSHQSTLKVIL